MNHHDDLLRALESANPEPADADRPEAAWTAQTTLLETLQKVGSGQVPRRSARRNRGPLIGLATAVVVIVVGIGAVLVTRGGQPSDVADEPTTTTEVVSETTTIPSTATTVAPPATTTTLDAATTTTTTSPDDGTDVLELTPALAEARLPMYGTVTEIVSAPEGLIAVEQDFSLGGVAWILRGDTWHVLARLETQPNDAVWFRGELWVSGSAEEPAIEVVSLDGVVRRPVLPSEIASAAWLGAIGVHNDELVLDAERFDDSEGQEGQPNFFRSSDGVTWLPFPHPTEPTLGHLRGMDEFVSAAGVLYVVGADQNRTVVWRTMDLVSYEEVLNEGTRWPVAATADGDDVLVVISNQEFAPAVTVFRIAIDDYTAIVYDDFPTLGPLVADDGFFLVTHDFAAGIPRPALWSSTDLRQWEPVTTLLGLSDPPDDGYVGEAFSRIYPGTIEHASGLIAFAEGKAPQYAYSSVEDAIGRMVWLRVADDGLEFGASTPFRIVASLRIPPPADGEFAVDACNGPDGSELDSAIGFATLDPDNPDDPFASIFTRAYIADPATESIREVTAADGFNCYPGD